jgi:hypothetical protein
MNEVNIYLTELVEQKKLSDHESQIYLDYAYDLVLDDYSDLEIENIIITDINEYIEGKVK